jgi:glucan 1,3-beta-glucosidase
MKNIYNSTDYPLDEWHLAKAFSSSTHPHRKRFGEEWFNYHFENFVTYNDLKEAKEAGITHVRVPMPHWILGDVVEPEEPWIVGKRWYYFRRLVRW